jgi:hypothetical protein
MRVIFRQIGGFAPVFRGCELDTESLPVDESACLQALIEDGQIFQLKGGRTPSACDVHVYDLTIETSRGSYDLVFDDLSVPESAKALLAFLLDRSHDLLP